MTSPSAERCPCGSGLRYDECCGPFHQGEAAPTALALMRSRYSAYALGLTDYLLSTWHPAHRPSAIEPDSQTQWRRLQIVDTVRGEAGDDEGIVEFRAAFRSDGSVGVLHERSRFERADDGWVYVDGVILDD